MRPQTKFAAEGSTGCVGRSFRGFCSRVSTGSPIHDLRRKASPPPLVGRDAHGGDEDAGMLDAQRIALIVVGERRPATFVTRFEGDGLLQVNTPCVDMCRPVGETQLGPLSVTSPMSGDG